MQAVKAGKKLSIPFWFAIVLGSCFYPKKGLMPVHPDFLEHIIAEKGLVQKPHRIKVLDLDNDSHLDIISLVGENEVKVIWLKNKGDLLFEQKLIFDLSAHKNQFFSSSPRYPGYLSVTDVDEDGDNDILTFYLAWNEGKILWLENTSLEAAEFKEHFLKVHYNYDKIAESYISDSNGSRISKEVEQNISIAYNLAIGNWYADLDRNGNDDLLGATDTELHFIKDARLNINSVNRQVIRNYKHKFGYVESSYADDLDGDGDLDPLLASYGEHSVTWYENDGLPMPGFKMHAVYSAKDFNPYYAYTADLDNDKDIDMVSLSHDGYASSRLFLFENNGRKPLSFDPYIINPKKREIFNIQIADLDKDGDRDIVFEGLANDQIGWFENTTIK